MSAGSAQDADSAQEREKALLLRSRRGDRAAFGEVLRLYQSRVFSLVRRLVGRAEEAVELTQETFLQAFRSRERYDPSRPFRPWLYRIAVNVCRNHLRRASRRESPRELAQDARPIWQAPSPGPDHALSAAQSAHRMDELLAQLSVPERTLLVLRYVDELSYDELVSVFHRPAAVLKMRVHRALGRLREAARGVMP